MAVGRAHRIRVKGHAGHAALPHLTRDPMVASAHLLLALQIDRVPQRRSAGQRGGLDLHDAGRQRGQPDPRDGAVMRGTMRTLRNRSAARLMAERIRELTHGVAQAFGMKGDVTFGQEVPVTANSGPEALLAVAACREANLPVRRDLPPAMTSEDFGALLLERPGAFVWIGSGEATSTNLLHNPGYDFRDDILPVAARYLAAVAKQALRSQR